MQTADPFATRPPSGGVTGALRGTRRSPSGVAAAVPRGADSTPADRVHPAGHPAGRRVRSGGPCRPGAKAPVSAWLRSRPTPVVEFRVRLDRYTDHGAVTPGLRGTRRRGSGDVRRHREFTCAGRVRGVSSLPPGRVGHARERARCRPCHGSSPVGAPARLGSWPEGAGASRPWGRARASGRRPWERARALGRLPWERPRRDRATELHARDRCVVPPSRRPVVPSLLPIARAMGSRSARGQPEGTASDARNSSLRAERPPTRGTGTRAAPPDRRRSGAARAPLRTPR